MTICKSLGKLTSFMVDFSKWTSILGYSKLERWKNKLIWTEYLSNQILIIERLTWSIYRLHDSCHLDQLIEHLIEEY